MAIAAGELARLGARLGVGGETKHQAAGAGLLGLGYQFPIITAIKAGLALSPLASDARFSAVAKWATSPPGLTATGVSGRQSGGREDVPGAVFRDVTLAGPGLGIRSAVRQGLATSPLAHDTRFAAAVGRWAAGPTGGAPFKDARSATPPAVTVPTIYQGDAASRASLLLPGPRPATTNSDFAAAVGPAGESRRFAMDSAVLPDTTFPEWDVTSKRYQAALGAHNPQPAKPTGWVPGPADLSYR